MTAAFDAGDTLVDIRHAATSGLAAVLEPIGVPAAEFVADSAARCQASRLAQPSGVPVTGLV